MKHIFLSIGIVAITFLLSLSVFADTATIKNKQIEVDGVITSTIEKENIVYVGGIFEEISFNNNPKINRAHFAEIDLSTESVTAFNPIFDGSVQDMAAYQNLLFIGGQFENVNGEDAFFVALNTESKAILQSFIKVDKPVYGLFVDEDILYVSGSFTQMNSISKPYIASYNLTSSEPTLWSPIVNDTVYDVVVGAENIYIGGAFTEVNTEQRTQIAAFNKKTGELLSWNPNTNVVVTNISLQNKAVHVTGYIRTSDDIQAKKLIFDVNTAALLSEEDIAINDVGTSSIWRVDPSESTQSGLMVDQSKLGFKIPTLADLLTFAIRAFFVISGLAALFYLLLGAFAWVTSGGDQDSVTAAREKIQAAVVGLLMMVAVLAIVWTLEQVIFNRRICLGLSCPLTIPTLLEANE